MPQEKAAQSVLTTKHRLILAVLAITMISFGLQQSLVLPALRVYEVELHTGPDTVAWILTTFLLSAAVFTPILGRVGDMIGKKQVLIGTLLVFALGAVLGAVANSISLVLIGRALQGCAGGMLPLGFGILRDEFPRDRVAGAVGTLAGLTAIGGCLGLVLAGPIISLLNYHWLFWLPGIVMGLAALISCLIIPASRSRAPGRLNIWAAVTLSAWLVCLLLGLSKSPVWGWASVRTIGLYAVATIMAVTWVLIELRSVQPLIDMRLMRRRAVWTCNVTALLFGAASMTVFSYLPQLLQTPKSSGYGFGVSITESGLVLLPGSLSLFLFGVLAGPIAVRLTARRALIAGCVLGVGSLALIALRHDQLWEVAVYFVVYGAGYGVAFSAMASIVVDAVPSNQVGVASGTNANVRTIGGAVGSAVVATMITSHLQSSGLPFESGYTNAFLLLSVTALVAALAGILIPQLRIQRDAHQREQAAMAHPELALVAGGTIVGDGAE